MFKSWFGPESGNSRSQDEEERSEVNNRTAEEKHGDSQLLSKAKGFSGYIYNFASSASKNLSNSVAETAQTLKKSVEEGKINNIFDKTILGDFKKEQEKFVQEQNAKKFGAAVPLWVGHHDEESVQQQILALSADKRNFLRDPPCGVHFNFDFEQMSPVAMVMLEEDELLRKMRFHLVPKQVKEEAFWKNYFYRVSLIKQSAQLTALAAQQAAERRDAQKTVTSSEDLQQKGQVKSPPAACGDAPKSSQDEEEISSSLPGAEFVSDAFDSCDINEEDLRKEMDQLVLDKREQAGAEQAQSDETPDWERELQEELREYDVLADNQNNDENWDKEIEEMLKEDS